jgi:hypothetical protein
MLAPPVAKAQAKTAESSTSKPAHARLMPAARPFGREPGAHPHLLQASIGNQARLRLLGARAAHLTGNETYGDHEQDIHAEQEADRVAREILHAPVSSPLNTPLARYVNSRPVLARQAENEPLPADTGTKATAEREREVEAINVGGINYVLYQTKVRGGGDSSSWLANNPGNLDYTADTVAWGCYQDKTLKWGQHRFAIFPVDATSPPEKTTNVPDDHPGMEAVRKFLRKNQTTRDIMLMMNLFAPAGDLENDPEGYANRIAKRIGLQVTAHTRVMDMSDEQIRLFAQAIKVEEGWKPGPVNDVPRGDPSLPEEVRNR